jgi:hypothetical protein
MAEVKKMIVVNAPGRRFIERIEYEDPSKDEMIAFRNSQQETLARVMESLAYQERFRTASGVFGWGNRYFNLLAEKRVAALAKSISEIDAHIAGMP